MLIYCIIEDILGIGIHYSVLSQDIIIWGNFGKRAFGQIFTMNYSEYLQYIYKQIIYLIESVSMGR